MVVLLQHIHAQKGKGDSPRYLYPFNALRNRALALSNTHTVLLLDVDFLPSPIVTKEYRSARGHAKLTQIMRSRGALVLPTLETAAAVGNGADAVSLVLKAVWGELCYSSWQATAAEHHHAGQQMRQRQPAPCVCRRKGSGSELDQSTEARIVEEVSNGPRSNKHNSLDHGARTVCCYVPAGAV